MKMENVTSFWNDTKHLTDPTRHLSIINQVLLTFFYVFGISSNICSLVMLARNETIRNRKQTLMVRCLVWNDLLALVGSSVLMYTQLYLWSELIIPRWFCMLRVLLRTFGLSSGCVAIVMAVERWLALTRPFQYQKHVTYTRIKQAIFSLWIVVLLLVCLPFLDFGVYYDSNAADKRFMCIRYRFATKSKDKVYAYLMFVFGLVLCLVIVYCNLAVVRVLCRMGKKCMARIGRTTIRKDSRELSYNHTTPEEISFAKFMVILCVFFVVCWVPQLITIPLAQINPIIQDRKFFRLADIGIALNFTLDPIVYVLSRKPHRKGLRSLLKPVCKFCWPQSDRSSSEVSATPYKPIFESCTPAPQQDLPATESEQKFDQGLNPDDVQPQSSSIQHFHCQCSASSDEGMDVNVTRCRSGLEDHIILEIRIRATSWGSATPSVYFHKNKCPLHTCDIDTKKDVYTNETAAPTSSNFLRAHDSCHVGNEVVSEDPEEILVPHISIENSPPQRCGTHGKASLGIAGEMLVSNVFTKNSPPHRCGTHGIDASLSGDHISTCSSQGIFPDVNLKVVGNTKPIHESTRKQNERTSAVKFSRAHKEGLSAPSLPLPPPPRGRSYSTGVRPYRRNLELYALSRPAEV